MILTIIIIIELRSERNERFVHSIRAFRLNLHARFHDPCSQNVPRVRSDVTTVSACRRTNSAMRWCPAGTAATSPGVLAGREIAAGSPRDSARSGAITAGVVLTR